MTQITRVSGVPNPQLWLPVPDFGLSGVTHYYHPRSWADGPVWEDTQVTDPQALPVDGDDSIGTVVESGRKVLGLTTEASILSGSIFDTTEVQTLLVVAKVSTTDGVAGSGYVCHNGVSGINLATAGSGVVSFTNNAPGTSIALDKYHLFSIVTPNDTLITRFTIDGALFTATNAASGPPQRIRVGSNNSGVHRAMKVAAVLSCDTPIAAATITGPVLAQVRAWWPEFVWG